MVYGLMADLHLHAWSAFSHIDEGMNNRLKGLLSEIERAADEVKAAGGKTLIFAGDVFHVRGSVSPVVLNATRDCLQRIVDKKMSICIMPGNHDLEGKESTRLSSAVTALEMTGVTILNQPEYDTNWVFVPWVESIDDLKATIEKLLPEGTRDGKDLFLHAPIDGVIKGLPSHGLTPEWLASLGFKRIFSGHYHNHKRFDGEVYSIGALAHHTWSDIGTRAGFLIIHDDRVDYRKSHLPEFIDLSQLTDVDPDEELPFLVDGNYVRVKTEASKSREVQAARQELLDMGAKAVIVQAQPKPPERAITGTATVKSGASLEVSVGDFVGAMCASDTAFAAEVNKAALSILSSVD